MVALRHIAVLFLVGCAHAERFTVKESSTRCYCMWDLVVSPPVMPWTWSSQIGSHFGFSDLSSTPATTLTAASLAKAGEAGKAILLVLGNTCRSTYRVKCSSGVPSLWKAEHCDGMDEPRITNDGDFSWRSELQLCLRADEGFAPVEDDPIGISNYSCGFNVDEKSCITFTDTEKSCITFTTKSFNADEPVRQESSKTTMVIPPITSLPGGRDDVMEGLLCSGQFFSAFEIANNWNPKHKPAVATSLVTAKIELPELNTSLTATMLTPPFTGKRGEVAVVWKMEDGTILVGGQGATPGQIWGILQRAGDLAAFEWPGVSNLTLSRFVGKRAESLWEDKGLGETLMSLAEAETEEGRSKRFIFAGVSHGAALMQVLSLRFELFRHHRLKECNRDGKCGGLGLVETFAITYNSYHTLGRGAATLVRNLFGNRAAHFIVSEVDDDKKLVVTDSVPAYYRFRRRFHDYPNTLLIDQKGFLRDPGSKYPEDKGTLTATAASRVFRYHMYPRAAERNKKLMMECSRNESIQEKAI